MVIYVSMFVYVFLIGYFGKTYVIKQGCGDRYFSQINIAFAILIFVLPVFFIGLRTNYIDTKAYINGFLVLDTDWNSIVDNIRESKSSGFLMYEWVIKRFISTNPSVFLMITAVIQAVALIKLYYKYSPDYSYSVLLFFLSCSFVNMMNGIRQFLAVSLIIFFSNYIFNKNYVKFAIVVIVAITIHFSAIVWIPVFFLVQGKPWNKKTVVFAVGIVLAVVFVDRFTNILSMMIEDTSYAGYTEQFSSDGGSNIAHTAIAFVPVFIAWIGRKPLEQKADKCIKIMVNISLVGALMSLLANFTSGILMGRLPIYFTVYNFALLPWLFDNVFERRSAKLMRVLCLCGYIAYAIYYMYNAWGAAGMPYISDVLGINTWQS